tara:strand:- start:1637 stop:1801 length:165 start_codon:yes stop_codon:yes gene_type:complete
MNKYLLELDGEDFKTGDTVINYVNYEFIDYAAIDIFNTRETIQTYDDEVTLTVL